MAGCFGNSREDRIREAELFRHLDKDDEVDEAEAEARQAARDRYEGEREERMEARRRGE